MATWIRIDAGAGNDTLVLSGFVFSVGGSGEVVVNLSSLTDQVVSIDGVSDATLKQIGFENLDASGLSLLNPVVVTGSDGANIITGGGGNDTLNGGLGNDTYRYGATFSDPETTPSLIAVVTTLNLVSNGFDLKG